MTLELFSKRLLAIKAQFTRLQDETNKYLKSNPFMEDLHGVPASWLSQLIISHLETLFASVNEKVYDIKSFDSLEHFINWYVYENNFGGEIWEDETNRWNLSKAEDLYNFIWWCGQAT